MPPVPTDPLSAAKDFNALSLMDLLNARDTFHVHLMNKKNVVGTAIGKYLIRRSDPWPRNGQIAEPVEKPAISPQPGEPKKGPKRLQDCEVRYYSWPCVLVFVSAWLDEQEFGENRVNNSDYIPPAIYLPDGREIPVCVVWAPPDEAQPTAVTDMAFPGNLLGGGYPVIADVQQKTHIASIGCLVTDGHKVYALTNRHVAGDPGEKVYALVNGKQLEIGVSSKKQISRVPFDKIYPGFPGSETFLNMDIGLIDVYDQSQWTAQVYGIGEMGRLADLNSHNLSLRLIGCPVRAYGCASRQMFGSILTLFYRYKSAGGFEYVSDFLIGPRDKDTPFNTAHGDSGTVWLLESVRKDGDQPELKPIAVQWGGQAVGGPKVQPYALATCLSTVCNRLDVDVVSDWNIGHPEYWGAVGHYSIAAKAIDCLAQGPLKQLMAANRLNITYDAQDIRAREMKGLSKRHFIPLADVPDYSFKMGPNKQREKPNHFADMDKPDPKNKKTLLQLCADPDNIEVNTWLAYYKDVHDSGHGALPFRVWQIFAAMVDYASKGDAEHFVCAAGILSHYLGDACQPLHISYLHDGYEDGKGKGVHASYEDTMVDANTITLLAQVNGDDAQEFDPLRTPRDAAIMTVALMRRTFDALKPKDIVDQYAKVSGESKAVVAQTLWDAFGKTTIKVMSNGARALAHAWQEAWRLGASKIDHLDAVDQDRLIAIYKKEYDDGEFIPSCTLGTISDVLGEAAGKTAAARSKTNGKSGATRAPKARTKKAVRRERGAAAT